MWPFEKPMIDSQDALPGRNEQMPISGVHRVNGQDMRGPFPEGLEEIVLGLGCFWGAERLFWQVSGVHVTAAGYAGGFTPNPTYEEACSGRTGHAEVVRVVFDPQIISLEELLQYFWEAHDPTQGMRQGNDVGTQYRSAIYTTNPVQQDIAERSKARYQQALNQVGDREITTEIRPLDAFYFAEEYHQQYLDKNPGGYCGLKGTGVACPISA